jgi:hypothetical protein
MVVAIAGMDRVLASDVLAVKIGGGALVGLAMGAAAAGITGFALVRVVPFRGSVTIATTPEYVNRCGVFRPTSPHHASSGFDRDGCVATPTRF